MKLITVNIILETFINSVITGYIQNQRERERNNSHEDTVFLMPTNFCFDSFVTSHEKFITVNVILEILINYETTEYPQNEREIKTTHMRIWFSLSMLIFVLFYFHVKFITVNVILKIFINSGTTESPQNHREREREKQLT